MFFLSTRVQLMTENAMIHYDTVEVENGLKACLHDTILILAYVIE
jgi:hypothetical protein